MIIDQKWRCDIGNENYASRNSTRNDIVIRNGDYSRIYDEVCDKHLEELIKTIDSQFDKNKYAKEIN